MSHLPHPDASAELSRHGLIAVRGEEARPFLHNQLTNDIEHLDAAHARLAGWCSPKGRLLASFVALAADGGILLQVARDIAPAVSKRLSMFVLRTKAKVTDESDSWKQYGTWGPGAASRLAAAGLPVPRGPLACATVDGAAVVAMEADRFLVVSREPRPALAEGGTADDWALAEIRAARPFITQSTQDQFVPQMANLEVLGGVDFKKGCYPGQEIVARTQYRGILKRRMDLVEADEPIAEGQSLVSDDFPDQASGMVVNAVGREGLAVLQIASVEQSQPVRLRAGGPALRVSRPPYAL
ncbi:MAG: folate-binding protein YgfZ [Rubrivivax sp.]|nr:folate-binding protein YgfZ [Rubrivivax sp.]